MSEFKIEHAASRSMRETRHILRVWEDSVRETHHFLTEGNILSIRPLVELGLSHVELFLARDVQGIVVAFMGIADKKIEMLFLSPDVRGKGLGRQFVRYARDVRGAEFVDVNEQNVQAVGFYERMGFEPFGRSERDPQGNPFPILHLRLEKTQA